MISCIIESSTDRTYSWNQRYQSETSNMLEELTGRLRELEIMAGVRRPSMWQHAGSTGSIGSNGSGPHYASPHNSAQGQSLYSSPPPQAMQASPPPPGSGYQASTPPVQQYPVQYHQPQPYFPQQAPAYPGAYMQPPAHAHPQHRPSFSFNDPAAAFPGQAVNTNPHAQFGAWGGYGGPAVPDTLDDENAVPPNTNAWETAAR